MDVNKHVPTHRYPTFQALFTSSSQGLPRDGIEDTDLEPMLLQFPVFQFAMWSLEGLPGQPILGYPALSCAAINTEKQQPNLYDT